VNLFSPHLRSWLLVLSVSAAASTLTGCGADNIIPSQPGSGSPPSPGTAFTGKVLAGVQPVSGSSVQLYAAALTGTSATALLDSPVLTDATGTFDIPNTYSCPSASSQLYLVASGGKVNGGSSNAAITLITVTGTCSSISSSAVFTLNEATTAASVWSLAQFLSSGAQLHVSATNSQGIANAVATVASLANITTGAVPGSSFPANGQAPTARINTLANLLHACTASGGSGSSACSQLFSLTTIAGITPTNTLDAALNLVQHPATNVKPLYTLAATSTAFTPALTAAPADWTLFINFTGGGMDQKLPTGVAVDSTGSVWVATYFGVASKFSPIGAAIFPSGITGYGLGNSYGIAIDAKDNAWIPNEIGNGVGNSVTVLNSSGQSVSGTMGFTSGGLNYPIALAIDSTASTPTTWVVDYGNAHVTLLSNSGQALSGSAGYYRDSTLAFPDTIVIDASHNAWIGNQSGANVVKVSPDGSQFNVFSCCDYVAGLALDQSGNLWAANYYGNNISEISTTNGTVLSNGGFNAAGTIDHPQAIAIDGLGNLWIANFRQPYLTQLAGSSANSPGQTLSPNPGWAPDSALLEAFALAIDASGNIWVSNEGSDTLTEFVGLASPVKTPLSILPQTP
jgi:hypothetical protein